VQVVECLVFELLSYCQGPIDDERNTDHAYMFSQAFHYHDEENLLSFLNPKIDVGSEIEWVVVNEHLHLFAEHKLLLKRALDARFKKQQIQWFRSSSASELSL
jgi:hypothetical protein